MSAAEPAAGAIYDIGYRHYDGPRLGRAGAVRALYAQGVRSIFGIGRGVRAKLFPFGLIAFIGIPALIQAAISGLVGSGIQVFSHRGYFSTTAFLFSIFCAAQAPELITGDQHSRVLALYFSRALRRSDYVFARFAALASSLLAVALLPHVILLLGAYFAGEDVVQAMKDSVPILWPIFGASLAIATLLASVSIAIAAVIRRRPLATAAILGVFLVTNAFVAVMVQRAPEKLRYMTFASPIVVSEGLTKWLFDTVTTPVPIPLPPPGGQDLSAASPSPASVARLGGDFALMQGAGGQGAGGQGARGQGPPGGVRPAGPGQRPPRVFRRIRKSTIDAADLPGSLYLAATLGYLLLASAVLALRYRSIEI
jgi:ABC-2 type transport system permease protein